MVLFSITREFPQLDPRVTCGKQQSKATRIGTRCYTPMFNGGLRRDLGLTTWSSAGGATGNRTKAEFPCEVNPDKSKLKMLNTCDSTLVDCTWHFDCLQNLPKFYFELRGMFLWCPIGDFPSLS